jgi:hypothetical protein
MSTITDSQNIEIMLQKILGKLEVIEERLCELEYPAESTIKPEIIKEVLEAERETDAGNYRECRSAGDFIENLKR